MVMMGEVVDSHEDMITTRMITMVTTILASKGLMTDFSRAWPWVSLYVKNKVATILLTLQPALRNRCLAPGIFCSKFRKILIILTILSSCH